jgi:hypothetical protein
MEVTAIITAMNWSLFSQPSPTGLKPLRGITMNYTQALAQGLVLAITATEENRMKADLLLMDLAAMCNEEEVEEAKAMALELMKGE